MLVENLIIDQQTGSTFRFLVGNNYRYLCIKILKNQIEHKCEIITCRCLNRFRHDPHRIPSSHRCPASCKQRSLYCISHAVRRSLQSISRDRWNVLAISHTSLLLCQQNHDITLWRSPICQLIARIYHKGRFFVSRDRFNILYLSLDPAVFVTTPKVAVVSR
jgi:hypothetical protein